MDIIFSILASIGFSISHISIRQGVERLGILLGLLIMLLSGMGITLMAAFLIEGFEMLTTASILSILYFAVAGLIHFFGGWGFMNAGSMRIGAARFGAMTSTTPMFASFLAFLVFQETLNLQITSGIGMIVVGIYLTATSKS